MTDQKEVVQTKQSNKLDIRKVKFPLHAKDKETKFY